MKKKGSYDELVIEIRDAIREKARKTASFDSGNGSIRIKARPATKEADDFLGGFSDFDNYLPDIATYENVFSIAPGGSHVIEIGMYDVLDTYAFSAMKIAACEYNREKYDNSFSGPIPDYYANEKRGYATYLGALCIEVRKNRKQWCLLWVSVAINGMQTDCLSCAKAAVLAIKEFFYKYPSLGCTVKAPKLPVR